MTGISKNDGNYRLARSWAAQGVRGAPTASRRVIFGPDSATPGRKTGVPQLTRRPLGAANARNRVAARPASADGSPQFENVIPTLNKYFQGGVGAANDFKRGWCGLPLGSQLVTARLVVGLGPAAARGGSKRLPLPCIELGQAAKPCFTKLFSSNQKQKSKKAGVSSAPVESATCEPTASGAVTTASHGVDVRAGRYEKVIPASRAGGSASRAVTTCEAGGTNYEPPGNRNPGFMHNAICISVAPAMLVADTEGNE